MVLDGAGATSTESDSPVAKKVTLHGGPLHGQTMALPDDWEAITIAQPMKDFLAYIEEGDEVKEVGIRKGVYSSVRYSPTDFEWDGWRKE